MFFRVIDVVLSLWYVFLFVWFLLVVFRIWHLVNSVHDETVIMTEGKSIPVWKSAFPAITICSQIKFSSPKFNFTQAAWTTKTKSEKEELVDASVLCDQHVIITDQDKEDSTLDMHNFIREAAHSFDEVLYSCSWKNELTNCSTLFKPTFTEEGLCFTFNAVDIWSNKR
ncbi:hypothetical protein AAG570_003633 [Ranatra chinensis]|uniref:ATP synthase F0 subunit 8 n=1 Tax=Ranatra chinensis TaxID=642074 RepID=A0ABD0YQZ5_9HEMI